jgi:hypothetical protein
MKSRQVNLDVKSTFKNEHGKQVDKGHFFQKGKKLGGILQQLRL